MRSMTGYGRAEIKRDEYNLEVEIKSYNNRFLEINHNISYALSAYESYIDSKIKEVAKRGHVEISVRLKQISSNSTCSVDANLVKEYKKAFALIEEISGLKPTFSDYVGRDGVLNISKSDDAGIYKDALDEALSIALNMLKDAKEREGSATKEDLKNLAKDFSSYLDVIKDNSAKIEEHFRTLFKTRFAELKADNLIDEERLNQEVALMIVKYTINEEIKRLDAHLAEYFNLLESSDPVGKRMDFLAQEMTRETNTIASKSFMSEISSTTIKMKDKIENIREQVRNIE